MPPLLKGRGTGRLEEPAHLILFVLLVKRQQVKMWPLLMKGDFRAAVTLPGNRMNNVSAVKRVLRLHRSHL